MIAQVLIDNLADAPLQSEWGLSIYIEHNGHTFLLDTGMSDAFTKNAALLGVDLSRVEFGVLSHAHYDHADGLEAFFAVNDRADFFLRSGCAEDCYSWHEAEPKYIGIRPGTLSAFASRIRYVSDCYSLCPGAWLIPHEIPGLMAVGKKAGMYRKSGNTFQPDDFCHEQSLVLETGRGLVIFNSCCHAGADRIVQEAAQAFPGKPIRALIGGLHLFRSSEEEICVFAGRIKEANIPQLITGHCTGDTAMELLRRELGSTVTQFHAGARIEFED